VKKKHAAMTYFRALPRHSTEMLEKYNKNLSGDTWCPRQDLKVGKSQKQIKLPIHKISSQIISRPSPMLAKGILLVFQRYC
jgi:hypothetical protein